MNLKNKILFISLLCGWSHGLSAQEAPYVMGVIGDSLSAGFNAFRYGDNRELSWSGGLDSEGLVQSHARRLKALIGDRNIVVTNEAFVGADSNQLPRQVNRLLRVKPDYVTIAIGSNDVCTWSDDYLGNLADYQKNVTSVIERIIAANPNVKIVLAPVPSIRLMYELGLKRPGCQEKWDAMGVCRPLLALERSADDRERFYGRLIHLNKIIEEIAGMYSANVRYAKAIIDQVFDDSMISPLDCFHPSIKGHNFVSELSFDPTWY